LRAMEGAVTWVVLGSLARDPSDYWARVTVADLTALRGRKDEVARAYRHAVAAANSTWFALDSSRQQLVLLQQLGFRLEVVEAALTIIDRALARLSRPEQPRSPEQVVLFSGHMIDRRDRATPRFPADREPVAAHAIDAVLDELAVSTDDLALCGGANGGD